MGGLDDERIVSIHSGENVCQALSKKSLSVVRVEFGDQLLDALQKERATVIYNIMHGRFGEDGRIQGFFDLLDLAYTGESVLQSALCFDKLKTKAILKAHFIKTPHSIPFEEAITRVEEVEARMEEREIDFPVAIKPICGGSSRNVAMVSNKKELAQELEPLLGRRRISELFLEERVVGRELTVGIRRDRGDIHVLPIVELKPKKSFYDYEAKYTPGMTEMLIPAPLSKSLQFRISRTARQIFQLFQFQECVRIDFMVDGEDTPYVLEINTSPGMTETSDVPRMLEEAGIEFGDFLEANLIAALQRKKATLLWKKSEIIKKV